MVVPNATRNPRFHDNPLVTGDSNVRFYAGTPLTLPSGESLGTLCIIDSQPRALDHVELAILQSLRDLAVEELARGTALPGTEAAP